MRAPLLTPAEAARELRVSEKQLRWLTNAGQIRYINVGLGRERECRRYEPADIDHFREARKCQSSSEPVKQRTATTSAIDASDFQALLDARQNAKRRSSKNESASA